MLPGDRRRSGVDGDDVEHEATLLAVGDIHLGRRPARLPADLARTGIDPDALTPAAAWSAVVERAIAEGVQAVLLAGDVVEAPDDFFEAYTRLDAGIRRLVSAGIPVYAVAGNHDVAVLPRLADAIDGFHVLGRGGRWEAATVEREGQAVARLVGWSFPAPRVESSPLVGMPDLGQAGVPVVGLLHCHLDAAASPHAPVRRRELERVPVDAWLLGHVHVPDELSGPRPIGYLGSLVGLDASEHGAHGPWRVVVGPAGVRACQLPMAPLRWEAAEVDVSAVADLAALHAAVVAALDRVHVRLLARDDRPRAVGLRLRLVGEAPRALPLDVVDRLDLTALRPRRDDILYFVERASDDTRPAADLASLARGADPAGLLARRLLLLEGADGPERQALLAGGRERLERVRGSSVYQAIAGAPLDDDAVTAFLLRAGRRALAALLAQREAAP